MFRLNRMEVVHWDFWQRFVVPLDASIITIVGPNGSGKTTFLDAMRTLLALECSNKRDYKRYVRHNNEDFCWLRGVVDNRRQQGSSKRPFGILFSQDVLTLACHIEKKGGDWVRRYWVADGDIELTEIQKQGQEFGVRDYQHLLHAAGLSPAIAKVLSLEQGQTDKLCEYKPRELLDLVFDVFGDKEVLSRYQEARQHQLLTEKELLQTQNNLKALENSLQTQEAKVNRYKEWQALKDEHKKLFGEVRPRLEFYLLQEETERAARALDADKKAREAKQAELICKQSEQSNLQTQLQKLMDQQQAADAQEEQLIKQTNALHKQEGGLEVILQQERQLKAQATLSIETLDATATLGQLEQQRSQLQQQLVSKEQQREQWQHTLENLSAGRRADPYEVSEFRKALQQAGIGHDTLSDVLEVTDPAWQNAVEAVLSPFAHVILIHNEKQAEAAFSLGEKLKYRHLIVPERQSVGLAPQGSLLEVVKLTQPVAPWMLHMLERTRRVENTTEGMRLPRGEDWVTKQGYLRERRGGRYAAPSEARFGKARLESLRTQMARVDDEITSLKEKLRPVNQQILAIRQTLAGVNAATELASRAEEFAEAALHHAKITKERQEVGSKLHEATSLRASLAKENATLRESLATISFQIEQIIKDIAEKENREGWAEQSKRLDRLTHDKQKLPEAWQDSAANKQLVEVWRDSTNITRRINEIEARFLNESWEMDDSVIILRDKMQLDYDAQVADVAQRQRDNDKAREFTENAREAYIARLRYSVKKYSDNLKTLGNMANIAVECPPVKLDSDDVTLAQAGLQVRFGFDEKGLAGMNDGDSSGGQQVMKSLILLVALMMEESRPGGFVFIDEPFAHLDIFNIKRVANFLKATKAQYLLTTPVTHNVDVYEPSMLTLVTAKKHHDSSWAPRVGVLVRESTAI